MHQTNPPLGSEQSQKPKPAHVPGIYKARPIDWGIVKNKKGDPQAVVVFEYETAEGGKKRLTWYGSFTGGAKPITMKSLVVLGLKGALKDLVHGIERGALNPSQDVEIDVRIEPDQKGQPRARVAFVNEPGGGLRSKMSADEVGDMLDGLDDEFQNFKEISESESPQAKAAERDAALNDDLPF